LKSLGLSPEMVNAPLFMSVPLPPRLPPVHALTPPTVAVICVATTNAPPDMVSPPLTTSGWRTDRLPASCRWSMVKAALTLALRVAGITTVSPAMGVRCKSQLFGLVQFASGPTNVIAEGTVRSSRLSTFKRRRTGCRRWVLDEVWEIHEIILRWQANNIPRLLLGEAVHAIAGSYRTERPARSRMP